MKATCIKRRRNVNFALAVLVILCIIGMKVSMSTAIAAGDKAVKVTHVKCKHSGCHCDTYVGYQLPNGRYKGACKHGDGWGHTCGHSPKEHGLKE